MGEHKAELELILSCLRQKYQQMDSYMSSTREMDSLADDGDAESFGVYVDMRENNIKRISQIDEQLAMETSKLPPELANDVRKALGKDKALRFEMPELNSILEADGRNRELHARIVELEKGLQNKLGAGQAAEGSATAESEKTAE